MRKPIRAGDTHRDADERERHALANHESNDAVARPSVIVARAELPSPWTAELLRLIIRYSTTKQFQPYNLVKELERRDLFALVGALCTAPEDFSQPVDAYIESIHSRNGFSRDRMPLEEAAAFDAAAAALLAPHAPDGQVPLRIAAELHWGSPLAPIR